MSELRIRNIVEWVIAKLKGQAKEHGHSWRLKLRDRLRKFALRPRRKMAQRAARLRDAIAHEDGLLPDSTASIREDRDRR